MGNQHKTIFLSGVDSLNLWNKVHETKKYIYTVYVHYGFIEINWVTLA